MADEIKCYANPAIAALFEACPDHEICSLCGCCDQVWDSCQACGGDGFVEMDDMEEWGDDETCGHCSGAGGWSSCLGRCDKNGLHAEANLASAGLGDNDDPNECSLLH